MKISNVALDLRTSWANSPEIMVYIDELPDRNTLKYEESNNLYFASNDDGYVSFFAHNPKREFGYGGAEFGLPMWDGSTKVIKGPWSSRAGVMNAAGFTPCVDVVYILPDGTKYSGHITVAALRAEIGEKAELVVDYRDNSDIVYSLKVR